MGEFRQRVAMSGGLIVLLVALLQTGCANVNQIEFLRVGAQSFQGQLDGDLLFDEDGLLLGTEISFDNVLDLDDEEDIAVFTAGFQVFPGFNLNARYLNTEYDGRTNLTTDITFLDQVFTIGTPVDSNIDLQFATLQAQLALFETPWEEPLLPSFAFGLLLGANYLDLEAGIQSLAVGGIGVSETIEGVLPNVGATAVVNFPLSEWLRLFADAEVSGIAGDYAGLEGHYLDARGRVGIRLLQNAVVGVGYQLYQVDVEEDSEFEADFTLDGLYIFGEIGF